MTTKTKIIIGILIILAISILIFGIVNNKLKEGKINKKQDEISNMMEYFEETNNIENTTNNINEIENNTITDNTVVEQNIVKNEIVANNDTIIGKEEKESKQENTESQKKQKAIELAKQEWAISIDSYDFEAELQSNGTYNVSVINKANRNVITIYNVNVNNGTVIE